MAALISCRAGSYGGSWHFSLLSVLVLVLVEDCQVKSLLDSVSIVRFPVSGLDPVA